METLATLFAGILAGLRFAIGVHPAAISRTRRSSPKSGTASPA